MSHLHGVPCQAQTVMHFQAMKYDPNTHLLCRLCWKRFNGSVEPPRIENAEPDRCCSCAMPTKSGIFVKTQLRNFPRCQYGTGKQQLILRA